MAHNNSNTERLLHNYYGTPNHDIFVHPNTQNILRELSKDATVNKIPQKDILAFKRTLYDLSRSMEQRILRGAKRYHSHRTWMVYNIGTYSCLSFISSFIHSFIIHLYIYTHLSFHVTSITRTHTSARHHFPPSNFRITSDGCNQGAKIYDRPRSNGRVFAFHSNPRSEFHISR